MGKKMIAALIALFLLAVLYTANTADASITAYLNRTTWVYAKPSTSSTRVMVAKGTKVSVLAVRSSWAWIEKNHHKGYIQMKYLSRKEPLITPRPTPRLTATPRPTDTPVPTESTAIPKQSMEEPVPAWRRRVERVEWFSGGNKLVKRGGYASIYDIDTGLILRIKRKGGTNHMDVEPATAADTAILKKIAGGTFSWKSHAVVLIAKGRYIASAINTMPHGEYTIKDNGFPGQFCLHMVGSKTHETNRINPEHQKSIERVLKWSTSS